jgi:argininosuccinate synthase
VASLETIAGAHGVGRFDRVAAVAGGGLRHEIHEAPAAVVLTEAHGALQEVTAPPELTRLGAQMADEYVRLVERGEWTSPARQAIDRFLSTVQAGVTGAVKVRLFKGSCRVVSRDARAGREAPVSR